jgi:divalent metal cation (Fe/Co/Zn/Cd) transporter
MGRCLVVEVEGFVAPTMTLQAAEVIGQAVEAAVASAVPQVRAVLWSPRAMTT